MKNSLYTEKKILENLFVGCMCIYIFFSIRTIFLSRTEKKIFKDLSVA